MTSAGQTERRPVRWLRWLFAGTCILFIVVVIRLAYPVHRQRQLNIELRKHDLSFDTRRVFDGVGWPSWIRNGTHGMFLCEVGIGGRDCTTAEMKLIAELFSLTYDGSQKPATCRLALFPSNVTDEGLAQLSGLWQLHELTIQSSPITDAGARHLQTLPNLRKLDLEGTRITDNGLTYIRGLVNLEIVCLDQTQITDQGVSYLSSLSKLKELRLSDTAITDAAIPNLAKLQSVRKLFVVGTKLTPAGVTRLQSLLPAAKVYGK